MHSVNYKSAYTAIIMCFILSIAGWSIIFSASFYKIVFLHKWEISILKPLFIRTATAIIGFLVFLFIPKKLWQKYHLLVLIVCFALLISVFIFGISKHGAKRWIEFKSFQIQPFEIFKPFYLAYLASYFSRHRELIWLTKRWLFIITLSFIFFTLVALQPNFASAISIVFVSYMLLFLRGIPLLKILKSSAVTLLILGGLLLAGKNSFSSHVIKRIERRVQAREEHPQVIQSKIAIISGGITGKGLGKGQIKYLYLPELNKDFIFSLICEETGLIGAILLLFVYLFIISSFLKLSFSHPDIFTSTYVAGFALFLFYYVAVHTGVNMGILPPTGLPLPFISFGGSSLLSNFISLGIITRLLREKEEIVIKKEEKKVIML